MSISEVSNNASDPAVRGENTAGGDGLVGKGGRGVVGESDTFQGVFGKSRDNAGIVGESALFHAVFGISHSVNNGGLFGANDAGGFGVIGTCDNNIGVAGDSKTGTGVRGASETGDGVFGTGRRGVVGESDTFQGVFGKSRDNAGIVGESALFHAVFGISHSVNNGGLFGANDAGGFGVIGTCDNNIGVAGDSKTGTGVRGASQAGDGVDGFSNERNGVFGQSEKGSGLHGYSKQQFGIFARSDTGMAGFFEGSITVTNDIILANADCAEDFDIVGLVSIEAGTVMVIDSEGALRPSDRPYDKCVAGVISGAGNYKPALILDKQEFSNNRQPIALMGKVYCKVDAQYGVIDVGDLLTTSPTPGHAMKADDPMKAFGSVIGKALRPLASGEGLIPILIALQ